MPAACLKVNHRTNGRQSLPALKDTGDPLRGTPAPAGSREKILRNTYQDSNVTGEEQLAITGRNQVASTLVCEYKMPHAGVTKFYKQPIALQPDVLKWYLSKEGKVIIYVDPNDFTRYYFDLNFLKA